jgi:hypothetical protein
MSANPAVAAALEKWFAAAESNRAGGASNVAFW